jgi:flagellar basal-body rod protein FlgF
MANGIYSAVTGAVVRQQQLDVVSHNLANVETSGHRALKVTFEEVFADATDQLHHVGVGEARVDLEEGIIAETGNPLDIALMGPGFLAVEQGGRTVLTRAGELRINTNGELTTKDGNRVLSPEGGPIGVPADAAEIYIDETGAIWDDYGRVGQLGVFDVNDPAALRPVGPATFEADIANLVPTTATVRQGFLEASNVNPVESMTQLVSLQRHFETMQQLIQTYRTLDRQAATQVGRVDG